MAFVLCPANVPTSMAQFHREHPPSDGQMDTLFKTHTHTLTHRGVAPSRHFKEWNKVTIYLQSQGGNSPKACVGQLWHDLRSRESTPHKTEIGTALVSPTRLQLRFPACRVPLDALLQEPSQPCQVGPLSSSQSFRIRGSLVSQGYAPFSGRSVTLLHMQLPSATPLSSYHAVFHPVQN